MIIAQISDSHIALDPESGAPTSDAIGSLERAVAHLTQLPARPDIVLVTGDCANSGLPSEYARFQELLRPLPMPVYVIPGNHDNRAQMLDLYGSQGAYPLPGFVQYVVNDWPVRLIALDTHVPGSDEGYLCADRLGWLEERLAEAPAHPTLLFMHHPPVSTGMLVTDQIGLVNADALAAIVARYPQVERIVAGHLHMAITRRFSGTIVTTCSATAHTLLPDINQPGRLVVQMQPPACLIHVWNESTGLASYTSLIGEHGPVVELHDGTRWLG